jgi:predicted RNA binding protein YcfA (HicA-like mRNA interferase family)
MKEKLPEIKVEVYPVKVRDVIRRIEADGWYLVTIKGDHRQFKHTEKKGRVTISGHLGKEMPIGTLLSVFKQAQIERE